MMIGFVIYVSTGVLQTMLVDTLRLHNLLGRKWLLLPTLANTSGMALCGLLLNQNQRRELKFMLNALLFYVKKEISNTFRTLFGSTLLPLLW